MSTLVARGWQRSAACFLSRAKGFARVEPVLQPVLVPEWRAAFGACPLRHSPLPFAGLNRGENFHRFNSVCRIACERRARRHSRERW